MNKILIIHSIMCFGIKLTPFSGGFSWGIINWIITSCPLLLKFVHALIVLIERDSCIINWRFWVHWWEIYVLYSVLNRKRANQNFFNYFLKSPSLVRILRDAKVSHKLDLILVIFRNHSLIPVAHQNQYISLHCHHHYNSHIEF